MRLRLSDGSKIDVVHAAINLRDEYDEDLLFIVVNKYLILHCIAAWRVESTISLEQKRMRCTWQG